MTEEKYKYDKYVIGIYNKSDVGCEELVGHMPIYFNSSISFPSSYRLKLY